MCLHFHHLFSACGHTAKHTPLSLAHHCAPVDVALRFWHDQPKYALTDAILLQWFGARTSLASPTTCREVWPSTQVLTTTPGDGDGYDENDRGWDGYWAWTAHVLRNTEDYYDMNGEFVSDALWRCLDRRAELMQALAMAREHGHHIDGEQQVEYGRGRVPVYPLEQLAHLVWFDAQRRAQGIGNNGVNVVLMMVNGACGACQSRDVHEQDGDVGGKGVDCEEKGMEIGDDRTA